MAARLTWTESSQRDLEAIAEYIARDSTTYAAATIERILAAAERVALFPLSGRMVAEYGQADLREASASPYRIIYRFDGDAITVVTVIHAARIWPGPSEAD